MKDARIVKEKMARKIKKIKKRTLKCTLIMMGVTVLVSIGAVGALLYNRLCFKGEVKDKYDLDAEQNQGIGYYILVKTWFGKKDFLVDRETYETVQIGDTYSFQKETAMDWVKLKTNKTEEDLTKDSGSEIQCE